MPDVTGSWLRVRPGTGTVLPGAESGRSSCTTSGTANGSAAAALATPSQSATTMASRVIRVPPEVGSGRGPAPALQLQQVSRVVDHHSANLRGPEPVRE